MHGEYIKKDDWNKMLIYFKSKKEIYIGMEKRVEVFVEAVYWIIKTGAHWRALPPKYGQWNSVLKGLIHGVKKEYGMGCILFAYKIQTWNI
jgi:hypothetical protein